MNILKYFLFFIIISCNDSGTENPLVKVDHAIPIADNDTISISKIDSNLVIANSIDTLPNLTVNKPAFSKKELVRFAKTLMGVPYKYASTDPDKGFDCSGFITYVFNHFSLEVPRSSVGFTSFGKEINLVNAEEGDLILFTGTNDSIRIVGHMGIVTQNIDTLKFIHSTSGRAYAVTITPLAAYYKKRFVKVIRVFSD